MKTRFRILPFRMTNSELKQIQNWLFIIILDLVLEMKLSPENENLIKLAYVLLEIVAQHLRAYFVKLWDQRYPDEKWQGDIAKRNLKLKVLLVKDMYTRNILNANEQSWDTTTLVRAIQSSSLNLTEGCRQYKQRTGQLRTSEEVDIIRDIRNTFYGHVSSMSCSDVEFKEVMGKIKSVARNIFGDDAEKEIEEVEQLPITPMMTIQVNKLLEGKLFNLSKLHFISNAGKGPAFLGRQLCLN